MVAESYALSVRTGLVAHVKGLTPAMAGFATTAGVAWVNGGYFPPSWGFALAGSLLVAAAVLVFARTVSLGRGDKLFLGALVLLTGWTAASIAWSQSVPSTVL